jgi:hypothetical protein
VLFGVQPFECRSGVPIQRRLTPRSRITARVQAGAVPTAGKLPAKLWAGNADARD